MPGELQAAREKACIPNHLCSVHASNKVMMREEIGRPQMLFIGASHVTHLESFVKNKNTPLKYSYLFRNTFFLGVGGTKWETCLRHFQGLDLTTNNKHLGNQWRKYYISPINPRYTIIILGSNSVDVYDKKIKRMKNNEKMSCDEFWQKAKDEQEDKLEELKPKIREVLYTIKANAPYSELIYMQIIPRAGWHPLSRDLARKIDKYIVFGLKSRYHIKDFRARDLFETKKFNDTLSPMPGMLNTDEVHMNGYGHRALIRSMAGLITHKWLNFKRPPNKNKKKRK